MLIVISPAKSLDFESEALTCDFTQPDFLDHSQRLIEVLRKKSTGKLQQLMEISPALSELNKKRYHDWQLPFAPDNAKQAVLAFTGDVYTGLEINTFQPEDIDWAQQHLRILSGLYGVLKPLDLIQPYRLEMGTTLKTRRGKNLYEFWGKRISASLNQQLNVIDSETLVNLASNEYFKAIIPKHLNAEIITPTFSDWNNGKYKMIGFFAKKARGRMSAWIIKNRIKNPDQIVAFNLDGYRYDKSSSTPIKPNFIRKDNNSE